MAFACDSVVEDVKLGGARWKGPMLAAANQMPDPEEAEVAQQHLAGGFCWDPCQNRGGQEAE